MPGYRRRFIANVLGLGLLEDAMRLVAADRSSLEMRVVPEPNTTTGDLDRVRAEREAPFARLAEIRALARGLQDESARPTQCLEMLSRTKAPKGPLCGGALPPDSRDHLRRERAAVLARLAELRREERSRANAVETERKGRRAAALGGIDAELARFRREEATLPFDRGALNRCRARWLDLAREEAALRERLDRARAVAGERRRALALRSLEGLMRDFRDETLAAALPALEREVSEVLRQPTAGRFGRVFVITHLDVQELVPVSITVHPARGRVSQDTPARKR